MQTGLLNESMGALEMKVLFLPLASLNDPGSRYRIYQYLDYLREQGVTARCKAGVSDYVYAKFSPHKGVLAKVVFFGLGALSRVLACFIVWSYDVIFIQRLVLPHVYPFPEMLILVVAGLLGKRIIFDFDDAIFVTPPHRRRTLAEKITDAGRVARVIARCDAVIAGNAYLADYARAYNNNVIVIPTTIDLARYPVKQIVDKNPGDPFVIGWIGTPSSLPDLNILCAAFQEITKRFKITVRIVGGQDYNCPGVRVEHFPWSLQDEVDHILSFDLGVMPLGDHVYAHGKCGLKLLQYMAAGIPAVASPIGVNNEIIKDGVNGYLAASSEEWLEKFSCLLRSNQLRGEIGRRGRETVERHYSIHANMPALTGVLKGYPSCLNQT